MKYTPPYILFGLPKGGGGGVLRMPDFNLDISRYAKLAIHRSRKQTAHDLREPLLLFSQDTQKRNPTAAMEFIGEGVLLEL